MHNERLETLVAQMSDWFCNEYPSLLKKDIREYRGWTEDILDLKREEDVFKLLVLAINWNTNISWEIGLGTFELLNEKGLLTVEKLSDVRIIETIKQMMKNLSFKYSLRQRIKLIQKRPYATVRKTRSGPRSSWVDAYHVAAINWNLIKGWLKVDEISKGNIPRLNGRKIIDGLTRLFRIEVNNKKRRMLVVKTFLICRELNCQNVVNIDLKYCCIPDYRVREQMEICGFPISYDYFVNSNTIANYFKKLYDLPLFYFLDNCKKMRANKCSFCLLHDFCAKNYSKNNTLTKLQIQEKAENDYTNRLHFEMKELRKNSSEEITQQKWDYRKVEMMERAHGEDTIRNFLKEIVNEINKQGYGAFELNETSGYFSIQRAGKKKYKNVVCFVKNEHVLSISKYANINKSLFENSPYDKLTKRLYPPQGLQLRKGSWDLYPHHVEYDLKEDKDVIFQLCRKACETFGL